MPLTSTRSWHYTMDVPADLRPVAVVAPKADNFAPAEIAVGILAAAAIGGFFAHVPTLGFVAGALGASVMSALNRSALTRLDPNDDAAQPQPRHVILLGADGIRMQGSFYSWHRVLRVSGVDRLFIELSDGTTWSLKTEWARQIAEHAVGRMLWSKRAPESYTSKAGGYRMNARADYSLALGLPIALRERETVDKRLDDFLRLNDEMKLRVLHAMADFATRAKFVMSSGVEVRRLWLAHYRDDAREVR